jgi:hypothetical protein
MKGSSLCLSGVMDSYAGDVLGVLGVCMNVLSGFKRLVYMGRR